MVDGRGIRFGLAGVKNVGEGAIENDPGWPARRTAPSSNLYDFCSRASTGKQGEPPRGGEPGEVRRLRRRAGESRASVWASLDVMPSRPVRPAQRDREIGQESLFGSPRRRHQRPSPPSRLRPPPGPIASDSSTRREVLGFYVTGQPAAPR